MCSVVVSRGSRTLDNTPKSEHKESRSKNLPNRTPTTFVGILLGLPFFVGINHYSLASVVEGAELL